MSKPIEANALYDQLCKAYKPLYYPTEEEKKEAIMILSVALYSRVKPEEMIQKAGVLSILHGNHKSKVTTLIINKFWEQDIEYGVRANKFKEEE